MEIVRTVAALRETVSGWRREGARVGVVPTMGALHEGHLGLLSAAQAENDRAIVTIFVNPRQFDRAEDLAKYPRNDARDAAMLAEAKADLLFAPPVEEVYPAGFVTKVSVTGLSEGLCAAHRPGHFDGVATVVTKLLLMSGADRAYFGEKDWQQLQIVRRLVRDLDIPTVIVGCPTRREADGLAMSSRNARLEPRARAIAPAVFRAMSAAVGQLARGAPVEPALRDARAAMLAAGIDEVEYLELRGDGDLAPLARPDRPARLLAAVWIGGVRLIDNIAVPAAIAS